MDKIHLYITLFFIYSFIGWLVEVTIFLVSEKKFINRGFLIGPFIPLYGVGCIAITLLLSGDITDPFALFLKSAVICGILEYSVSLIMEKIFKARWWDYSHRKFNINGRVCFSHLILFGLGSLACIFYINPFLFNMIDKISIDLLKIINITLIIVFLSDIVITLFILFKVKNKIKFFPKDSTEEISEIVKKELLKSSTLIKRLVLSFPNLKFLYNKFKERNKE